MKCFTPTLFFHKSAWFGKVHMTRRNLPGKSSPKTPFEWALPDCLLVKVLWRKVPSRDRTESSPNLGLSWGASPVLSGGGSFNFADDVADWTDRFSWSVTHRKKRGWSGGAAAAKGSKTSQQRKRESGSGGKAKTTSRTAAKQRLSF